MSNEAMKLRTAAEKVVELCGERPLSLGKWFIDMGEACESLREALAEQPAQQEPWGACVYGRVFVGRLPEHARKFSEDEGVPIQWLYTSPPAQRKPLTEEEITAISKKVAEGGPNDSIDRFVRAIEASHGIKENT